VIHRDRVIQTYFDHQPQCDYVSNALERTYPRGMDTEVFSFESLSKAYSDAIAQPDQEHVTPFILHRPERFNLIPVLNSENHSHHRWTVDTPEDFELIKRILEAVYPQKPNCTMEDCLNLLKEHPEWQKINAHVEQKKYGE